MDTERTFTRLIENEVLSVLEATGEVELTARFCDELDANRELVTGAGDQRARKLREVFVDEAQVDQFDEIVSKSPTFVARLVTLADFLSERPLDELVQMTIALDQFFRQPPPEEGVPEAFYAINGDQLDVLSFYNRAIVYVWRHDCEPCDRMRAVFDELFPEPPEDIALFAVYGPDWSRELKRNYDVTAGPSTLFVVDGRVDARLLGSHHRAAIEAEIEQLRELSTPVS